jgi:hypothetical protein
MKKYKMRNIGKNFDFLFILLARAEGLGYNGIHRQMPMVMSY